MRSSKSRSRSKQNRPRTIGNIINRVFESSGPEGKVRGTPQQVIEKYQQLARDAQLSNDRVAAENFSQHAEHYTRMLGEATREMAAEQEARQQQYNQPGGQTGGNQGGQGYANQNGGNQGGNQNGGNQGGTQNGGNQTGNRERDNRDYRDRDNRDQRQPWRDERNSDQPDAPAVIEAMADTGLVDTPETRSPRPDAEPQRDPRPPRQDRGPNERGPRPQGDQPRRDRGPRPERHAQPDAPPVAPPEAQTAAPTAPAPAPHVEPMADHGADTPAKPRRARAPKKPKPDGGDQGQPETAGSNETAE